MQPFLPSLYTIYISELYIGYTYVFYDRFLLYSYRRPEIFYSVARDSPQYTLSNSELHFRIAQFLYASDE